MSGISKMKMSNFKSAIMALLQGGHYAREGHIHYETRGPKTVKFNQESNR